MLAESLALSQNPLPTGGQAILAIGTNLWVGGTDRRLYHLPVTGGTPKPRGPELSTLIRAPSRLSSAPPAASALVVSPPPQRNASPPSRSTAVVSAPSVETGAATATQMPS